MEHRMKKLLIAALAVLAFAEVAAAGGYHYVRPHYRDNGSFVPGHMQGNPDGYCFNNLGGC